MFVVSDVTNQPADPQLSSLIRVEDRHPNHLDSEWKFFRLFILNKSQNYFRIKIFLVSDISLIFGEICIFYKETNETFFREKKETLKISLSIIYVC